MSTARLEAFSDGVLAIVITIMVLELRPPEGIELSDLIPVLPTFLAYVLSFVFLAIYWNNHHHLLQATKRVSGGIMWANIHLLFWLSVIPFTTSWMSEHPGALWPTVVYGINLLMPGFAYRLLVSAIIREHGPDSDIARAIGSDFKGYASLILYLAAIFLAFVNTALSYLLFVAVAVMWLVPDKRVEGIVPVNGENG
jgi:uncharacterized membrane protein